MPLTREIQRFQSHCSTRYAPAQVSVRIERADIAVCAAIELRYVGGGHPSCMLGTSVSVLRLPRASRKVRQARDLFHQWASPDAELCKAPRESASAGRAESRAREDALGQPRNVLSPQAREHVSIDKITAARSDEDGRAAERASLQRALKELGECTKPSAGVGVGTRRFRPMNEPLHLVRRRLH